MPRDSKLVLIACYLAIFAVGENSTAIMAALPAMSSSLGLGRKTVEWAVNAYLLAAAALIGLGGVGVAIAEDDGASGEGGEDDLGDGLGAVGEHEGHFGGGGDGADGGLGS